MIVVIEQWLIFFFCFLLQVSVKLQILAMERSFESTRALGKALHDTMTNIAGSSTLERSLCRNDYFAFTFFLFSKSNTTLYRDANVKTERNNTACSMAKPNLSLQVQCFGRVWKTRLTS